MRARTLFRSDYHPIIRVIQVDISHAGVPALPEFHLPRKSNGVVTVGYKSKEAAEVGMFEGFDVADDARCIEEVDGWIKLGIAEAITLRAKYLTLIPLGPFVVDLGNQRFRIEIEMKTADSGGGRHVPVSFWICARPLPESEGRRPEFLSARSWPTKDEAQEAWENGFELDAPDERTLVRQIADKLRADDKAK